MELLPAIDILGGKVVRLAKGDYDAVTIYNDDPVAQAREFERAGARWIHVVDLDGARTGTPENIETIERILDGTFLKVEVGGGIRSLDTIKRLYDAGVSRVVLGTALVANRDFAKEALAQYGDLLAAGIDAKDGEVAVEGWREGAGVPAEELIAEVSKMGFKHLIFTDIARDGMQTGIDTQRYVEIAKIFGHPVIASGGVANNNDIAQLGEVAAYIEGVIAGRAVYEGTLNVAQGFEQCDAATNKVIARFVRDKHCGECMGDGCADGLFEDGACEGGVRTDGTCEGGARNAY